MKKKILRYCSLLLVMCLGIILTIAFDIYINDDQANFEINDNGQTFGSSILSETEAAIHPDLILALGVDGTEGYVLKEDLFGTGPITRPNNPEEALIYMEQMDALIAEQSARAELEGISYYDMYLYYIPLYASDGRTVIGEFGVSMPAVIPGEIITTEMELNLNNSIYTSINDACDNNDCFINLYRGDIIFRDDTIKNGAQNLTGQVRYETSYESNDIDDYYNACFLMHFSRDRIIFNDHYLEKGISNLNEVVIYETLGELDNLNYMSCFSNCFCDEICFNDYYNNVLNSNPPSKPHCIGFGMTHSGSRVQWVDFNESIHVFQRVDRWTCDRSNCSWYTDVQLDTDQSHNFVHLRDLGHVSGTATHRWNDSCNQCGRNRTRTLQCLGPPCFSPMTSPTESD